MLSPQLQILAAKSDPTPAERDHLVGAASRASRTALESSGQIRADECASIRRLLAHLDPADEAVSSLIAFADRYAPLAPAPAHDAAPPAAAPVEPPHVGAPAQAVSPRKLSKARAALDAAAKAAAQLRDELATATATAADAKREALATDTPAAWDELEAATKRATRLQIKSEAADTEEARAKATLEALERAALLAQFEAARDRASLAAVDALLAEAVAARVEHARAWHAIEQRENRIVHAAFAAHRQAIADLLATGARLGMSRQETGVERLELDGMIVLRRPAVLAGEAFAALEARDAAQ